MIHATTPAPIERPARAARLSASPAFSPSCTTAARHGALAQRLAGLALALGLAACGGKDAPATEPQGPAAVGVVTLQTRAQQLDATLPGRTRAYLTAEVRPQVSGIVQQRLFTEGALVRKGQALYQIDDRALRAAEASAEAARAYGPSSRWFETVDALLAALTAEGDALLGGARSILVKGSRFMRMERVVKGLAAAQPVTSEATH